MSETYKTGWVPDYPDHRDYTLETEAVKNVLVHLNVPGNGNNWMPSDLPKEEKFVDLSPYFSPVEDQQNIGSCTAHAAVGLLEYFERRAFNRYVNASRLFVYKTTRNLLQWQGDTGAFLRTAMASLVLFGAPPEKYWPYDPSKYEDEPTQFVYSLAQNYQTVKYVKLDPPTATKAQVLENIKDSLTKGIPSMFGFTVYRSLYSNINKPGHIPYPSATEKAEGGHAICAVGFSDNMQITNPYDKKTTTGALKIRNSWGTKWGESGYGFIPYEYVLKGLAIDWWTLISAEWVDTGQFGL